MAAEVIKQIDPDNGGGTDYTSLDAWEDALGGTTSGNLPSDDQIAIAVCRSSSGTADTAAVSVLGWTTDATRYIEIRGDSYGGKTGDFPSDGVWDATKYVLHDNDANAAQFEIREAYVKVRHLQMLLTETSTNTRYMVLCNDAAGTNIEIDSCFINGACSGTGAVYGIFSSNASVGLQVYNTIIANIRNGTSTNLRAVRCTGTVTFYNCTIYKAGIGISQYAGTCTAYNTVIHVTENDIDGTVSLNYCWTDDGDQDGSNGNDTISQTTAQLFVDADNGDLDLASGSELIEAGTNNPGSGLYSDDIIGTARS